MRYPILRSGAVDVQHHQPHPYLDDYEREWRRIRAELENRGDSAFEAIVDTMVLPEVLVGGEAWEDSDFDNPNKRVRFYAGRLGSRGFVVVQLPGETLRHAEGFTITACDPRALGERSSDCCRRRTGSARTDRDRDRREHRPVLRWRFDGRRRR